MIQIAALWMKEKEDGTQYFTGNLGNARLVVLPNKFKKANNHPDFIIFVAESRKRNGDQS